MILCTLGVIKYYDMGHGVYITVSLILLPGTEYNNVQRNICTPLFFSVVTFFFLQGLRVHIGQ